MSFASIRRKNHCANCLIQFEFILFPACFQNFHCSVDQAKKDMGVRRRSLHGIDCWIQSLWFHRHQLQPQTLLHTSRSRLKKALRCHSHHRHCFIECSCIAWRMAAARCFSNSGRPDAQDCYRLDADQLCSSDSLLSSVGASDAAETWKTWRSCSVTMASLTLLIDNHLHLRLASCHSISYGYFLASESLGWAHSAVILAHSDHSRI